MKKKIKKVPVLDKFPLIYVEWIDAESDSKWDDREGAEKWLNRDFVVHDIGWLIMENDKYIIICNQVASDGDLGNRTKIPRGWITKLTKVSLIRRNK